jgi:nicotinamide-nucleotide amidase
MIPFTAVADAFMFPADIHDLARRLIEGYAMRRRIIAAAESCTGGLIASALTQIPGSSDVFDRGFVTYSNAAKAQMLDVPEDTLARFGAVSAETAEAMAQGAVAHSRADIAVSVTGIAGPGGGTAIKPVGLVYIGLATRDAALFHYSCHFKGDRDDIRLQAVREALKLLLSSLEGDEALP